MGRQQSAQQQQIQLALPGSVESLVKVRAASVGLGEQLQGALARDLPADPALVFLEPEADVHRRVAALEGAPAGTRPHEGPARASGELLGLTVEHVVIRIGVARDRTSGLHVRNRLGDVVDVVGQVALGDGALGLRRNVAPAFEHDPVAEALPERRRLDARRGIGHIRNRHHGATMGAQDRRRIEGGRLASKGVERARAGVQRRQQSCVGLVVEAVEPEQGRLGRLCDVGDSPQAASQLDPLVGWRGH